MNDDLAIEIEDVIADKIDSSPAVTGSVGDVLDLKDDLTKSILEVIDDFQRFGGVDL